MKLLLGSFGRRKREIAEEFEVHLRMATQRFVESGMDAEGGTCFCSFGNSGMFRSSKM